MPHIAGSIPVPATVQLNRGTISLWESLVIRSPWKRENVGSNPTGLTVAMPERSNGAVCGTVVRGFESH